jgi:sarcosine oxidase
MYTNSPDAQFVIDQVPGANVRFASACSGHGFKFASAIGELLAAPAPDVPALFRSERLRTPATPR